MRRLPARSDSRVVRGGGPRDEWLLTLSQRQDQDPA